MSFTLIALVSAFFGAIANILARILLREHLKSRDMLIIGFLTIAVILAIFSPTFYFFRAAGQAIPLLMIVCLIDALANFFYFKTFEKTEATIATPILSLAPGFTFILGWFWLGDIISWQKYLTCAAIIVLIIIFTINFKDFDNFKKTTLYPAMMASILFGISAIPSKILLDTIHAINAPTLYLYRAAIISLSLLVLFGFQIRRITATQYSIIFIRSLFVIVQWLLLYFALATGSAGVTITLGNITPIFVFLLGVLFLKERITIKKIIASGLILVLSLTI